MFILLNTFFCQCRSAAIFQFGFICTKTLGESLYSTLLALEISGVKMGQIIFGYYVAVLTQLASAVISLIKLA